MTITPDTKNWTWVIERQCPECGFVAAALRREDVGARLRVNAAAWQAVLAGAGGRDVHERPEPTVWSPLEYACHVRDVCRIFDERLALMLTTDDPRFANWDQDATAVADRYAEQDPARVAVDLAEAAERLAARFDEVSGADWDRPSTRSDGSGFTVESFARYFLHDVVHHLYDVTGVRAD